MNAPRATVVMTLKDERLEWIRAAVESIRVQTFTSFRALMLCDGEPDPAVAAYLASVTVADSRFESRVLPPRGLTLALLSGLADVRTEFILRHDADDWSAPLRFECQIRWLDAHADCGLLGSNFFATSEEGETQFISRLPLAGQALLDYLTKGSPFCHGSVVMRRAAYERAGGYRPSFSCAQDYDLFWRMTEVSEAANLSEPLYYFRRRRGSISSGRTREQVKFCEAARLLAAQRAAGRLENDIAAIAEATRRTDRPQVLGRALLRSADYLLLAGDLAGARRRYWEALCKRPLDPVAYGKLLRCELWRLTPKRWRGNLIRQ